MVRKTCLSLFSHTKVSQGFFLPHNLYFLGPSWVQPLEQRCRDHFILHSELVHEEFLRCNAAQRAKEHQSRVDELRQEMITVKNSLDKASSYALNHYSELVRNLSPSGLDSARNSTKTEVEFNPDLLSRESGIARKASKLEIAAD